MATKMYSKCSDCGEFTSWDDSYMLHLELNVSCNVKSRGKYKTYICKKCGEKLINYMERNVEDADRTTEETKDES